MISTTRFLVMLTVLLVYEIPTNLCQIALQTVKRPGIYSETMHFVVDRTIEYSLFFPKTITTNPYTIQAWSTNASIYNPVMVVARQENDIVSWEVPLSIKTSHGDATVMYYATSKTMCNTAEEVQDNKDKLSHAWFNFVLTVSTSCPSQVNIFIRVEEESQFYVNSSVEYSILVTPSESKYVHYKFPENKTQDNVLVQLTSENNVCVLVSVQIDKCPVLDKGTEITYRGRYQTLSKKGGISVEALGDPFNRTSNIRFRIVEKLNLDEYWNPTKITITIIAVFTLVCVALVWGSAKFGNLSSVKKSLKGTQESEMFDLKYPQTKDQIDNLLGRSSVPVSNLAQYPIRAKKKSYGYLWHIFSIATFYSIPVVQLVLNYQAVVMESGNYDICYYNFHCAHPALGMIDFNHVFSNIGYVIIGCLFLFVSIYRHSIMPIRQGTGIPVHYGLFYAMGIALIIEGVLSACYHVCPRQENFQFDTSFMYVIAVLCMIKLYQNRHPDINATAYATFAMLGIIIFLAMFGLQYGTVLTWLIFAIIHFIISTYLSFKVYFFGFIVRGLKKFCRDYRRDGFAKKTVAPLRKSRFILLLVANVVNFLLLILGVALYRRKMNDFGTFLLALLMVNAILYSIFYTTMKLINKERICIEAAFYGVLAIGCWGFASYFFFDPVIQWTGTPAESRLLNQDCIWMGFYDKHDIWHLLSAPALYFTFMFLISLDDDLIETNQEGIEVF